MPVIPRVLNLIRKILNLMPLPWGGGGGGVIVSLCTSKGLFFERGLFCFPYQAFSCNMLDSPILLTARGDLLHICVMNGAKKSTRKMLFTGHTAPSVPHNWW